MSSNGKGVDAPRLFDPGKPTALTLADRFLVPPFSVLDARAGYWQQRKQQWANLGIRGELGRAPDLTYSAEQDTAPGLNYYRDRNREQALLEVEGVLDSGAGRSDRLLNKAGGRSDGGYGGNYDTTKGDSAWGGAGTSLFDPVLCELIYRWFCPAAGQIYDPFAGGSVRGIVAAALELSYFGTDLSGPQVEANREQAAQIGAALKWPRPPSWACADAREALAYREPHTADLIFTCPPYYNLEVYSDDPRDLSCAPDYATFLAGYQECIELAARVLKPDRFAAICVGNVRGPNGTYVGLVPDTCAAFKAAGLTYYNEAVLVTSVGSLPIRTSRAFGPGRKLGKTHQNVLIFCKGDWRKAAAACPLPAEVAIEYGGATWAADSSLSTPAGEHAALSYDPDADLE